MAVLEKIRQKQVLLFTVIIVALLLFILSLDSNLARSISDLFTGNSATTMMSVGRTKVDQAEYKRIYDQQQEQYKQQMAQQGRAFDSEQYQQEILTQIAHQALLDEQYKALGIKVTDDQISKVMLGDHPLSTQFIQYIGQAMGLPSLTGEQLSSMIQNPSLSKFPPEVMEQVKSMWINQEFAVENQLKYAAYSSLVNGLFTANELDAKANFNDNLNRSVLSYVSVPVIVDESIEVTDAEVKNQWEKNKAMFWNQEPMRVIDFIQVNIDPSAADLSAANKTVTEAVAALEEQPDLTGIENMDNFNISTVEMTEKDIKARFASIPAEVIETTGAVYRMPYNFGTRTHSIAKVLDRTQKIDSAAVSYMAFGNEAERDSLLALLNGGKSFETLVSENPGRGVYNEKMAINGPGSEGNGIVKDFVAGHSIHQPAAYVDSISNIQVIMQIESVDAPVTFINLATITYEVEPSNNTQAELLNELTSYVASNSKAKAFRENAIDSVHHYNVQTYPVSASSTRIGNLDDSRQAIKWAMEKAKVGDVSKVYRTQIFNPYQGSQMREAYYVIAVREDDAAEYIPYTSVLFDDTRMIPVDLKHEARVAKKGAEMAAEYNGKATDLAGYAAVMGNEVRTDSTYSFNGRNFGVLGSNQPVLRGAAAAAAPGQVVGPIVGEKEVVVFTVTPEEYAHRAYDFNLDGRQFLNNFGIQNAYEFDILAGKRKVKNNSLHFVVSDEDRQ